MLKKFFGHDTKKKSLDDSAASSHNNRKKTTRSQTIAIPQTSRGEEDDIDIKELKKHGSVGESGAAARPKQKAKKSAQSGKRKNKPKSDVHVDTSQPLEFPCTPELVLAYHKQKPFLSSNEEWLIVELNEFECLLESYDIIKVIAKHSKFFEIDPDELWEEFFEFVEEVPSYDEVINYDVWQEFRDKRYPC